MQAIRLSKKEKQALKILKISVNENTISGISIKMQIEEKPSPEVVKSLFKTIIEQWNDNPGLMFKILGFFDLPKFLNRENADPKMG